MNDYFLWRLKHWTSDDSFVHLLEIIYISYLRRLRHTSACSKSFPPIVSHGILSIFSKSTIHKVAAYQSASPSFTSIAMYNNNVLLPFYVEEMITPIYLTLEK